MGSLATAAGKGFPGVATFDDDEARHRRQIAIVLNNVLQGRTNNTGTLTITANVATTTLNDSRIGPNSAIVLMPTTANAAAALTNIYFTGFGDSTCTVNHANNAQTDRVFNYAVIG